MNTTPETTETDTNPKPDMNKTTHFFACGLGSGMLPKVPGTWGSLAAIPFAYLLLLTGWPVQLAIVTAASLFGIWLCGVVTRDLKVHDHGSIVWDEFCGMWIALMLSPVDAFIWTAPLAFVLFRLFDILKPGPIGWLDRNTKGGLGVMADDILAGLVSLGGVQATLLVFH